MLDSVTISAAAKHRLREQMTKLVQQLLDEQKKAASASKEQASQAALDAVQQVRFYACASTAIAIQLGAGLHPSQE